MQTLNYHFAAQQAAPRAVHIGVVASGDLEILLATTRGGRPGGQRHGAGAHQRQRIRHRLA